jgi:hypothetical protein
MSLTLSFQNKESRLMKAISFLSLTYVKKYMVRVPTVHDPLNYNIPKTFMRMVLSPSLCAMKLWLTCGT